MKWTLFTVLLLLLPGLAGADVTSFKVAGTQTGWLNVGATTVADVDSGLAPPQAGRSECDCIAELKLTNFGFTTGDVPVGSVIDGITFHWEFHGGGGTNENRRKVHVWIIDENGNDCLTISGESGLKNHLLTQSFESVETFTYDDDLDATWNCGLTDVDILDVDFGVHIDKKTAAGTNVVGLDFFELQISYTPPGGDPRRLIALY